VLNDQRGDELSGWLFLVFIRKLNHFTGSLRAAVCLSQAHITTTIHTHPLRVRRYFRYVERAGCTKCHIRRLAVEFPKFSASAKKQTRKTKGEGQSQ